MTIVLKALKSIALGEFIPSHWLTDPIKERFNLTSDENEDDIISGMGSIVVVLVTITSAVIIVAIMIRACKNNEKV